MKDGEPNGGVPICSHDRPSLLASTAQQVTATKREPSHIRSRTSSGRSAAAHSIPSVLDQLDARAEARGVSRNRLIIEAVSAALAAGDEWSPEFLAALNEPLSTADSAVLVEMTAAIAARRTRSSPPDLG